ncbi:MAG: LamG domain-containing protein [Verrucomicrobiales bacterium]|nr:LamG domain-containing protein [Verrucomicrobiales bacterium]
MNRTTLRHAFRFVTALLLPITLLALLALGQGFAQVIRLPGLVASWRGEGDANDSTGSNNGTLQGGVLFTPGAVGDAFDFDGLSGFIEIASSPSMDFAAGDFTIVAWLRFNSLSTDQEIIHKVLGAAPDDQAYYLEFDAPNMLRFAVRNTSANVNDLFVPTSLVTGNWYLVAAVRKGNTNILYLNGTLIGSQESGVNVNTGTGGNARIGRLATSGVTTEARFFSGAIDEISLYNRALPASEIQRVFNSGNVGPVPDSMTSISFQGALNDSNGQPLANGSYTLTFKLYDVPTSGRLLGSSVVSSVTVSGGIASAVVPVSAAWFDGQTRYLGISIDDGQQLSPRVLITTVPYALRAGTSGDENGNLLVEQSLQWGTGGGSGGVLHRDQGGSVELGNSLGAGVAPYLDFHYGTGAPQDFNVRLINVEDSTLRVQGPLPVTFDVFGTVAARNVGIGTTTPEAPLDVRGTARVRVLQITGGADLAEHVSVADVHPGDDFKVEPGMVVSIDSSGNRKFKLSDEPYDRKRVGIISGANGVKPGLVLRDDGNPQVDGEQPVALTGQVWCHADASFGPIEPGDLLTTSSTPGHAMKATDDTKARFTVLGQALTGLKEGRGWVQVLVGKQ